MARDNLAIYNLGGRVEYIDGFEKEGEFVEVHEYCCDVANEYFTSSMVAEGHIYDDNIPKTIVRNYFHYCQNHK